MGSSAKVSSLTDSVLGRGWRSDKLSYQRGKQEVGARVEEIEKEVSLSGGDGRYLTNVAKRCRNYVVSKNNGSVGRLVKVAIAVFGAGVDFGLPASAERSLVRATPPKHMQPGTVSA